MPTILVNVNSTHFYSQQFPALDDPIGTGPAHTVSKSTFRRQSINNIAKGEQFIATFGASAIMTASKTPHCHRYCPQYIVLQSVLLSGQLELFN